MNSGKQVFINDLVVWSIRIAIAVIALAAWKGYEAEIAIAQSQAQILADIALIRQSLVDLKAHQHFTNESP